MWTSLVQTPQGRMAECKQESRLQFETEGNLLMTFSLLWGESVSFLLPSTDWIRSPYIMGGSLLYSESANCNVNPIQNEKTFIGAPGPLLLPIRRLDHKPEASLTLRTLSCDSSCTSAPLDPKQAPSQGPRRSWAIIPSGLLL